MRIYITKRDEIIMLIMALLCVGNVFGLPLAELATGLGLILFFRTRGRGPLEPRFIPALLRKRGVVLLGIVPATCSALVLPVCMLFFQPAYVFRMNQLIGLLSPTAIPVVLLLVIAEEIAWRGYFLSTLTALLGGRKTLAVLVTALVFSLGKSVAIVSTQTTYPFAVVAVEFLLPFVCSVFFGLLYQRTGNVLLCAGAHLLAELAMVLSLLALVLMG